MTSSRISLRSHVLNDDSTYKFIDPITLDVMKDPVIATDGKTYDRDSIVSWFETKRRHGQVLTSPITNIPLTSDILITNTILQKELQTFETLKGSKDSFTNPQVSDIQFTLSSEIFKDLDRIAELPQMQLLELQPPKIVVIGNESHGKSTILERIIGLPLFPKEKGLCTRCVIRVHLRRCVNGTPSIAEIVVKPTNIASSSSSVHSSSDGGERGGGGGGGGSHRPSKYARNSDGHRVIPTKPRQPQFISSSISSSEDSTNDYPVVFAAMDNIRLRIQEAMDQLIQNDPHHRMVIDDHEIVVKINLPYCLNLDIVDVPGLVTTSPERSNQNLPEVTQNLAMKIIQEEQESSIFLLVNDVRVPPNQSRGCAIIQQCQVQSRTLGIFTKLDTFVSEDEDEVTELGNLLNNRTSNAFPVGYGWMVAASRKISLPTSTTNTSSSSSSSSSSSNMTELRSLQFMDKSEKELISKKYALLSCTNLLGIDTIRQKIQGLYENFIQDNWIPEIFRRISEHLETLTQTMIQLGLPLPRDNDYTLHRQLCTANKIELRAFASTYVTSLLSQEFALIMKNAESVWIHLGKDEYFWKSIAHYHGLFSKETEPFLRYHAHRPILVDMVSTATVTTTATPLPAPLLAANRVVDPMDVPKTRSAMEEVVRTALDDIYAFLRLKIQQTPIISLAMIAQMVRNTNDFKLERFPKIIFAMENIITNRLLTIQQSFDNWYVNFRVYCFDGNIIITEYFTVTEESIITDETMLIDNTPTTILTTTEKVACRLYWSKPDVFEQYPHIILEKWYELIYSTLTGIENDLNPQEFDELIESCKPQRLQLFQQIKDILEVRNAMNAFSRNVEERRLGKNEQMTATSSITTTATTTTTTTSSSVTMATKNNASKEKKKSFYFEEEG